VGRVTIEEHRRDRQRFLRFLAGQTTKFLRRLGSMMREASRMIGTSGRRGA